jgi:hypothetical protein
LIISPINLFSIEIFMPPEASYWLIIPFSEKIAGTEESVKL